jgi:hypothetical protein
VGLGRARTPILVNFLKSALPIQAAVGGPLGACGLLSLNRHGPGPTQLGELIGFYVVYPLLCFSLWLQLALAGELLATLYNNCSTKHLPPWKYINGGSWNILFLMMSCILWVPTPNSTVSRPREIQTQSQCLANSISTTAHLPYNNVIIKKH